MAMVNLLFLCSISTTLFTLLLLPPSIFTLTSLYLTSSHPLHTLLSPSTFTPPSLYLYSSLPLPLLLPPFTFTPPSLCIHSSRPLLYLYLFSLVLYIYSSLLLPTLFPISISALLTIYLCSSHCLSPSLPLLTEPLSLSLPSQSLSPV